MTQERSVAVIVNPAAGKGRAKRYAEQVQAAMPFAEVCFTERPGHATELAKAAAERGVEIAAALGGDGTVRETAAGLFGSNTALGVLPLGSGNDFARALKIPLQLDKALDALLNAEFRPIDVGEDADGLFVCMSGVGFASEVTRNAANARLFRGPAAYAYGVVKALLQMRPVPMRLHLDGETREMEALFVLAQNIPYCGGGQLMAPNALINDGKLDVVVVEPVGRLELLRIFPRVYSGRHIEHPACHVFRSSVVRIESEMPMLKLLDGDLIGEAPLDSRIHSQALRAAAPSSS
ncbi:MAG: diacylglycerol kinase family lipid kinase [Candidatus Poribacteria bacterium]|nr:diacylglycerol kinase family lipid kinase [Candidatus Poribacteria bacterium]